MGPWKPAATDSSRVPGDSRGSVLAHPPAKIMFFYNILSYFIIFYSIFHYFTEKSIKSTFWPGFLPLQGTPTGENNVFLFFFIRFYSMFHHFTEKSIKCTCLPGLLPLQGTPTGKNNGFLHYLSLFYRNIDKMHISARIFTPARHTHRHK